MEGLNEITDLQDQYHRNLRLENIANKMSSYSKQLDALIDIIKPKNPKESEADNVL